jgi:WD40 repeat protein
MVAVLDPATGTVLRRIRVTDEIVATSVAFDPATGALITGHGNGTIRFWDAETGQPLTDPIQGPPAYVRVLTVSASGDRAVSLGHDGTVAAWDIARRRLLARLPTRGALASAVAISSDGRQVIAVEPDGTATVWSLDENDWYAAACALAGRRLTEDEWRRFLPELDYAPAC